MQRHYTNGHLGCFHFMTTLDRLAQNIYEQVHLGEGKDTFIYRHSRCIARSDDGFISSTLEKNPH